MKKNLFFAAGIILLILVLGGCAGKKNAEKNTEGAARDISADKARENSGDEKADVGENASGSGQASLNVCPEEKVGLPNYGDPGERLKNCFVKYPGESSREDKSYFIVEDICGQFTQQFMENMYGSKLNRLEPPQVSSINNCTYYFDEKEYVMLNLEYLSIENQKKGNEAMGRKTEKNSKIPMENIVTFQEDGAINVIYLVLSPKKFISLRPSSKKAIEDEKFISLAANIAGAIKGYK